MPYKNQCQIQRWMRRNPGPPWKCYFCGKNILERGTGPQGFSGHHLIAGDENSIVPAHRGCHSTHHNLTREFKFGEWSSDSWKTKEHREKMESIRGQRGRFS